MALEVKTFHKQEEAKLKKSLKLVNTRKDLEMQSVEQRLNSALNELQIAFREQREALKKRQETLKKNFKNKEMNKLNKANIDKDNQRPVQKFRNDFLRKQPFKNSKFRKTLLNKENRQEID